MLLFSTYTTKAQNMEAFGFEKKHDIKVSHNGAEIPFPWIGGLNNAQINQIHLNNDEFEDILIFDSHGNKIYTFLFSPESSPQYTYAPEYEDKFPDLKAWVMTLDYNQDGLLDIFTYETGGIIVYKNTSTESLSFELEVYPYISSFHGSGETNILVTDVDYPIIHDLDNDGDLDIGVFWGLGSYVRVHKNLSQELYGHNDSLKFELVNECWGDFAESEESNELTLNACEIKSSTFNENERHTGSTMLVRDFNSDGRPDFILSDIDYPGAALLLNSNDGMNADFDSYTFDFPNSLQPISLFSFPLVKAMDMDQDGDEDIIVSTFDPSYNKSKFYNNIHFYENENNQYTLIDSSLIQSYMLDFSCASKPLFVDLDHDGLKDIIVSNYGYQDTAFYSQGFLKTEYVSQIAFLKNTGTTSNPEFTLIDRNLGNLSQHEMQYAHLAIHDIDSDGTDEALIGLQQGRIMLFDINQDGDNFNFELVDHNYLSIQQENITPFFFDINHDELIDIICGAKDGKLKLFLNHGTSTHPDFILTDENLGNVNVTNLNEFYFGYSTPFLFEKDNETHLFCGSLDGQISYYTTSHSTYMNDWKLISEHYLYIDEGIHSSIAASDINNDDWIDIVLGNYQGGLNFYSGKEPEEVGFTDNPELDINFIIAPNPSFGNFVLKLDKPLQNTLDGKILTISGQILENFIIPVNQSQIQLQVVSSGMYFVQLTNDKGNIKSKKLIIR
jgi:hypothetical protein